MKTVLSRLFGRRDARSENEYIVNGMRLRLPAPFIAMFGHCLTSNYPLPTYFIETEHMKWSVDHTTEGTAVADIGASGGLFTAALSKRVGPRGRVFAFEPARRAQSFLQTLIDWNAIGNVTVVPCAISNRGGRATFHELPSDAECTWRPEASALQVQNAPAGTISYEVPITTVDAYFSTKPTQISLIKIDIEGFEGHALRGGMKTIVANRPHLCIDIHNRLDGDGDTEPEVRALLTPLGYTFERRAHVLLCSPG